MMQRRLVLRIQGLSAPQQPVVQRLILEMTQLLLVAAGAVDSSTVLSSSLQISGVMHSTVNDCKRLKAMSMVHGKQYRVTQRLKIEHA